MQTFFSKLPAFLKSKWTLGIIALVVIVGGYVLSHRGSTSYQFVSVTRGSITEQVSVTGNTAPTKDVSLGFQNSGTIARVYYSLGDSVSAGQVIAVLNTASLSAALQEAQANVDTQQADLDNLKAGAQPADIASSQASLQKAQQDLANLYASISDASNSAYAKANDAVRTQLNPLFANAETAQPKLTYNSANSQAAVNAQNLRLSASTELNLWQAELSNTTTSSSTSSLAALQADLVHLQNIKNLLNAVSTTLDSNTDLSDSELLTYKSNVSAAVTEVNAAVSSLNTISQNISSQQQTVAQAQAQLQLKEAGSTSEAIAAQSAQVEQAQAQVASAQANLQGSEIVAPISGVITQQDATVGEQAVPGTPLVSVLGNQGFEVDAGVSETDIGKIVVGDSVSMTLDAFSGETFTGKVFYVSPSPTNTQGVISYPIKISFDKADSRIKSGLTANIEIQTDQKNNVLLLPEYAILQNDAGTYVEVLQNNKVVQVPVTLGIQDQNGNVEVVSGATEGEQVINIGLKSQ